jgi:hypothetical protein
VRKPAGLWGFKCFVRAGWLPQGDAGYAGRDRETGAGFQSFGCLVRLA